MGGVRTVTLPLHAWVGACLCARGTGHVIQVLGQQRVHTLSARGVGRRQGVVLRSQDAGALLAMLTLPGRGCVGLRLALCPAVYGSITAHLRLHAQLVCAPAGELEQAGRPAAQPGRQVCGLWLPAGGKAKSRGWWRWGWRRRGPDRAALFDPHQRRQGGLAGSQEVRAYCCVYTTTASACATRARQHCPEHVQGMHALADPPAPARAATPTGTCTRGICHYEAGQLATRLAHVTCACATCAHGVP